MSFVNTQQSVTFSGLGRSVINQFGSERTIVSGGLLTVASGAGVLFDVITHSSGALNTQSGSAIWVYDAISGITAPQASGAAVFYSFNFGSASGTGTGGIPVQAPDLTALQATFKSGLVVLISGAAGTWVTVVWSKGV